MGLLNPALLLLGIAIAVPIILHLFQRHQGPRVVFPALRYLRRAEKESARRIRLRQLLLMLLRVAAILLLALAAARPFALSGGAGHEPTAVVIVLDNSMSTAAVTGDRRVVDELKELALAALDQAGADDRFWLLRAGAPWEPALPGDAAATAVRVRETEPTAAAADLSAALDHARALLAAGAEGRATEIHLLSDLQARSFAGGAEGVGPPVIVWAPGADPPANATVSAVEVGAGLPPTDGQRSTVTATIAGTGVGDSSRVRLAVEGRIVAAGVARPGAAVVLPFPPRPAGLYTGWVETDADALRADDRRFFVSRVLPPPAVSLPAELSFVGEALAVMEDAGRVRLAAPADADVGILAAGAGVDALGDRGTAVILPPESELELPAVNRRLGAAGVPWRYEPAPQQGEARFELDVASDELMGPLERVRLTQVYALRRQGAPAAGDTVLLRLRDGAAWAVRGERPRGGRYILLASPLTATATTVPTSAAMVPLLDRLVGPWANAAGAVHDFLPGEEVTPPAGTREIEFPDGRIEPVSGGRLRLGAEAGIHLARSGDAVVDAYAVNAAPSESDLRRLDARALRDRIGGRAVETADSPEEWARDVYRNRLGRELWRPALLLALLLLLVEAIVASSGGLRQRRARGEPATAPEPALAGVSREGEPI